MAALVLALVVVGLDQALKLWLLYGFGLAARGVVPIAPFFDLVLAWNTGISYGLFQNGTWLGLVLLTGFKLVATIALVIWLLRTRTKLARLGLALIIGGAIGNAIDRILHGAVVDYALLYAYFGGARYNWYVFNLADVAIVAGVVALMYDMIFPGRAAKAP